MKSLVRATLKKPFTSMTVYGAFVTLIAGIIFSLGWLLDIPVLTTLIPGTTSIKFNTAICFILLAVSQLFLAYSHRFNLVRLLAGICFLMGLTVLVEYSFNLSIGIDELFFKDLGYGEVYNSFPGRMSPISALNFIFIGSAFFIQTLHSNKLKTVTQILLQFVMLFSFIAILGYFTGIDKLYKISDFTAIAIHTAVCFFVLSASASFLNPSLGLIGLFTGHQMGNLMAKKLVSRVVITIMILTTLRILADKYNFVDVTFGIVLFALSFILTFLYFTWAVAKQLNKTESEKENAENTLARVSQFLNATPDPVIIVNSAGIIIFANKQTEIVFGYKNGELIGQPVNILIPTRYQHQHNHYTSDFFSTPKTRAMGGGKDLLAITKDKVEIPVEISLNPIDTNDGLVVSASIRDISLRKQAELLLKRANEQYATFVKEAPSAIAMFDNEMKYIAASDKWMNDYQLKGREVIGASHYEIFPEIGDDWKQIHKECLQGATNKCDEAFFERADGTMQWISWDVRPWYKPDQSIGGIIMLTNDLTTIKQKELEKQRFENILEKTSSISQIGAWEVNLQNGFVHWSKVLKEILKANDDFAPDLQSAINMYSEGINRDLISTAFRKAAENGETFDIEVEITSLTGKLIPVRVIGQIETLNGRSVKLYGILQNLERIKQTEKELKELLDLSNDQNKRLKNFAHIVSHNLRSHSGNIHMLLQRLIKKQPELATKEIMQHIITGSASLQETISSLSDIVIMNTSTGDNMTLIPLKETIDKCISVVAQQATEESVSIINEVPGHLHISGVKAYTESILLNFLTNGIKYRSREKSSYIRFHTHVSDKFLILSIEDNGLGIDLSKNGSRLFGMYKTFHGNADARGLGLFMSKNQLEAMGGRIEVDSKLGVGTNFKIFFQQ